MSSTNGKNKNANDSYQTPVGAVEALLKELRVRPTDKFLEPCRGDGNIFNRVPLRSTHKFWAEIDEGIDYLETPFDKVDLIVTNPPFSLTEEFLRKSFSELAVGGTICYLQRLNYLGAVNRLPFWAEIGFPEKTSVLVPRPKFTKGSTDSCEYAWFIWDFGNRFPNLPEGLSHSIDKTNKKVQKILGIKNV